MSTMTGNWLVLNNNSHASFGVKLQGFPVRITDEEEIIYMQQNLAALQQ